MILKSSAADFCLLERVDIDYVIQNNNKHVYFSLTSYKIYIQSVEKWINVSLQ